MLVWLGSKIIVGLIVNYEMELIVWGVGVYVLLVVIMDGFFYFW